MDNSSAAKSSTQRNSSVRPIRTYKRKNKSNPSDNIRGEEIVGDRESKKQRISLVNEEDRLSDLNDNVLIHVLSFLPTLDAIRTCVLSKRWTDLWTCVPSFCFNLYQLEYKNACKSIDQFVSFVEKTMILNRSSKIFKFHLQFQYHLGGRPGIQLDSKVLDFWTRVATNADVEELALALYEDYGGIGYYDLRRNYSLPRHIFACSSLIKLDLSHCNIVPLVVINWKSLKTLSIKRTELNDDVMQIILSGSPALEVLEIFRCSGLKCLEITSASLKKLVIIDYWWWNNDRSFVYPSSEILEILAPNLKALEILGEFGTKCRLVDVSSLVSAHIGFELNKRQMSICDSPKAAKYFNESQNMLRELLSDVRHVKELTLGTWCFQIITKLLEVKYLHSPLLECKSLMLNGKIRECELQGMARLLQNLPHLEMLTIYIPTGRRALGDLLDHFTGEVKISWASIEKTLNSLFLHALKTVKILGCRACNEKLLILLAEFLLKNARVLETMVFTVSKKGCYSRSVTYNRENVLKIAETLQSFPRSSPHANISFSWSHITCYDRRQIIASNWCYPNQCAFCCNLL